MSNRLSPFDFPISVIEYAGENGEPRIQITAYADFSTLNAREVGRLAEILVNWLEGLKPSADPRQLHFDSLPPKESE